MTGGVSSLFCLGLTGGIGSGKSTVSALLAVHGAAVIDADGISRAATAQGGAAIDAIRQAFGDASIASTGALDRNWMRELVFRKPEARAQLEGIIHPIVGREIERQAQAAPATGARFLVYDIPLLVESGRWFARLDAVLVVDCSEDTQMARVQARDGLAPEAVQRILASQATRARRLACADAVICNDTIDRDVLAVEVSALVSALRL